MIHVMGDLEGFGDYKVNCKNLFTYIKLKNIPVTRVNTSEIQSKEVDETSERFKLADVSYPIIVCGELVKTGYRLIDGAHRLQKLKHSGSLEVDVYHLTKEEVLRFLE